MTREETIKKLSYIADEMTSMECADWKEAIYMAIKALEQEPCNDTINREKAIKSIKEQFSYGECYCDEYSIVGLMNDLPLVAPNQKTGHWILTIEDWNKWTCSECGFKERTDIHVTLGYRFCPKCGAKMRRRNK